MPFADVGGARLWYEMTGDGEPVVLIGGIGAGLNGWTTQVNYLSRSFRCLSFDNRGAGQSDKPDMPYSTALFARDTLALMDAVGMVCAHVVGVSMGGAIAQEMALAAPGRVSSLALLASWAHLDARSRAAFTARAMAVKHLQGQALIEASLPWMYGRTYFEREAHRIAQAGGHLRQLEPQEARSGYLRQNEACLSHDTRLRLGVLAIPTLVVTGDEDIFVPAGHSEQLAALIPGAELTVLRECGHGLRVEAPDQVNAVLEQFLRTTVGD